jgi:hypothetical protein
MSESSFLIAFRWADDVAAMRAVLADAASRAHGGNDASARARVAPPAHDYSMSVITVAVSSTIAPQTRMKVWVIRRCTVGLQTAWLKVHVRRRVDLRRCLVVAVAPAEERCHRHQQAGQVSSTVRIRNLLMASSMPVRFAP